MSFVLLVGLANLDQRREEKQSPSSVREETAEQEPEEVLSDADCSVDIDCWAKRHLADATKDCNTAIYNARFSDAQWKSYWGGTLVFYHWTWVEDNVGGFISYWGDIIRYGDGREVRTTLMYNCRYNPKDGRSYLDINKIPTNHDPREDRR